MVQYRLWAFFEDSVEYVQRLENLKAMVLSALACSGLRVLHAVPQRTISICIALHCLFGDCVLE